MDGFRWHFVCCGPIKVKTDLKNLAALFLLKNNDLVNIKTCLSCFVQQSHSIKIMLLAYMRAEKANSTS